MTAWIILLSVAFADGPFDDTSGVTLRSSSSQQYVYEVGEGTVTLRRSPGPDEPRSTPRCAGGGADLFVDGAVDEQVVQHACARLETHAPFFAAPQAIAPQTDAAVEVLPFDASRQTLEVVTLIWLAVMALAAPRARWPWIWFAAALGVRASLGAPIVLMGKSYPYMHLMGYAGNIAASPLYGEGWFAVMAVMRHILGAHPDRLHVANLVFSSLTVPWLWEVMSRWTGDRRVANFAAAMLTTLPLAITLAGSEVFFVLCALLAVTAVAGVARHDTTGEVLAATSGALLAHARPDQIPFAAGVLVALTLRRRWAGALGLAVAIGARVWAIGIPNGHDGFPNPSPNAFAPSTLLAQWWGAGSSLALPDPWVHPFWLLPAAIYGWYQTSPAIRRPLLLAAVAATLPYAHMYFATDVLRFQLPAATWWVSLASLSAPSLASASRRVQAAALLTGLVGLMVAHQPGGPLVTRSEYHFLRSNLPSLKPGEVLRYDALWDDNRSFRDWAERIAPIHAVPLAGNQLPVPNEVLFVGIASEVAERAADHPAPSIEGCDGQAIASETVPAESGGLLHLRHPEAPVTLRLIRIRECQTGNAVDAPPPTPPPPAP